MIKEKKKGPQGANLKQHDNYNTDPYHLPNIKAMVAAELKESPALRDDDFHLIAKIYHKYYDIGGKSFLDVMTRHYEYGLPSFESIRRCRQKLQHDHPATYGSSQHTREKRQAQEAEFYAFSIGG